MEPKKRTECSFCSDVTDVVQSNISGKSICWQCVYHIMENFDQIPAGSMYCFKCESIDGFRIYTTNRQTMLWSFVGLDSNMEVIYQLRQSESTGLAGYSAVSKIKCDKCSALLPTWMMGMNRYVQAFYSTSNKEEF